jgi:23S rRNA pseudouridine1911/1915/1917 synthase
MARRKVDPTWFDETAEEEEESQILEFQADSEGVRLDHFLVQQMPERSRSQIQDWIDNGRVMLDGRPSKSSQKLKVGQEVLVEVPPLEAAEPEAESIPLDILFEDEHILVLNKPRGLVIHPAYGNRTGTLVNALLGHCKDLSGIRGVEKPGIVHRLDKDTSGVMVVAKNDQAHLGLTNQFQARQVQKFYEAVVHGHPQPSRGRIEQPMARHKVDRVRMAVDPRGKTAITDYDTAETFGGTRNAYARVDMRIHTGRTHQIRVHLSWLGCPIVGDPLYGRRANPFGYEGQALHCKRLGIRHPNDHRPLEFSAEPPPEYRELLRRLRESQ